MDFRKEKKAQNICYWGQVHNKWLESKINTLSEISPLKFNLLSLNSILESLQIQIERYNDKIKQISQTKKYAKTCRALECFRGLDTLTAMTLVSEIGDIKRFPHPRNLMSYTGFSIAEYSSGGKEKRFKITKIGNPFIRTVTVEACQFAFKTPHISRHLAKRRLLVNDPTLINIADKCMMRLHKKSTRLLFHGKHRNKIKVACAREMLGFIWDVMQKTAA